MQFTYAVHASGPVTFPRLPNLLDVRVCVCVCTSRLFAKYTDARSARKLRSTYALQSTTTEIYISHNACGRKWVVNGGNAIGFGCLQVGRGILANRRVIIAQDWPVVSSFGILSSYRRGIVTRSNVRYELRARDTLCTVEFGSRVCFFLSSRNFGTETQEPRYETKLGPTLTGEGWGGGVNWRKVPRRVQLFRSARQCSPFCSCRVRQYAADDDKLKIN